MSSEPNDLEEPDQNRLGKSAKRGIMWLTGSRGTEQVITFFITMLLARLLTPADYGILGMATLVLVFLGRFVDFGTAESIVQMHSVDDRKLSSIFWFNLATGLAFGVVMLLLAPVVANFFREPSVQPVIAVLALSLPLQASSVVPEFILRRRMQFGRLVIRNLIVILLAGVAAVGVALAGGGVWALVTQQLAASVIGGLALWGAVRWRPRLYFSRFHLLEIKDFTAGVLGFNVVNYFNRNIDYLLIGRFLTPTDLGLYTLAYRLMRYPTQFLSTTASQALFPVFSRMQDDPVRMANGYIRVAHFISLLSFPIMIGMIITANDFVAVVFGPDWLASAPILIFLTLGGLFQPTTSSFTAVVWARGLSQWQLRHTILQTGIVVAGFVIGLQWGIYGMSASYAVTGLISTGITIIVMFPHCYVSRRGFLRSLALPALATLVMVVTVYSIRVGLSAVGHWPERALFRLCIDVTVGAFAYIAILFWREPSALAELRSAFPGVRRRRVSAAASDAVAQP